VLDAIGSPGDSRLVGRWKTREYRGFFVTSGKVAPLPSGSFSALNNSDSFNLTFRKATDRYSTKLTDDSARSFSKAVQSLPENAATDD
jgi:hypothetical protein